MNSKAINTTDDAAGYQTSKIARELIHELQNHLHLAIMEVELAQMGASERFDYTKLLGILESLKNCLHGLQACVLSARNPCDEDKMTG